MPINSLMGASLAGQIETHPQLDVVSQSLDAQSSFRAPMCLAYITLLGYQGGALMPTSIIDHLVDVPTYARVMYKRAPLIPPQLRLGRGHRESRGNFHPQGNPAARGMQRPDALCITRRRVSGKSVAPAALRSSGSRLLFPSPL
jgi:hypothetical protein